MSANFREALPVLEPLESRLLLSALEATAVRGFVGTVAIDCVAYPLDAHPGKPWSQWGKGIVASNGKVYSAIGDHGPSEAVGIDGNSYVYEYDPVTKLLRCVMDLQSTVEGYTPGDYGWGKIHGRINEGADGNLYFGSYWGTSGTDPDYVGDHVFRYNPYTGVATDLGMVDDGTGYTKFGFPSNNMWPEGMIWYAEIADKGTEPYGKMFLAYDLTNPTDPVKFLADHPGTYIRAFFVDSAGNAYLDAGNNTLKKYDPTLNQFTTVYSNMPGTELRQTTAPTEDGYLYGLTGDTYKIFRFDPTTGSFTTLTTLPVDSAAMDVDPSGRYIYYVPGSHVAYGSATLYQYDTVTGSTKSIVSLKSFVSGNLGINIGGSYNLTVSDDGRVVYIGFNGDADGDTGFDNPLFVAVHIPDNGTAFNPYPVGDTSLAFENVAQQTGIEALVGNQYSHAAAWGDVNNDGYPDLYFGAFKDGTSKLLINNGGVNFTESVQSVINIEGRASGGAFVDFDNDGDMDLVVANNADSNYPISNKLYRNDGDGIFTDVTAGSNLDFGSTFKGRNTFVLDYDGDGLVDLFMQEDEFGGTNNSRLMRNLGDFVFQNVNSTSGIGNGVVGLGGMVGDINGDGWPDIINVYTTATNRIFINNGNGTFRSISAAVINANWPTSPPGEKWIAGAYIGDLDNDGDMDLVIGQHYNATIDGVVRMSPHVYRNDGNDGSGNPILVEVTTSAGVDGIYTKQPHVQIADFDNDGWMDILTSATMKVDGVPQPVIYHNEMGTTGTLQFTLPNMNPNTWDGALVNPRYHAGAPVADFDRDGRLDVFGEEFDPVPDLHLTPLYRNVGATENFLNVSINAGPGTGNINGIGALVQIYKPGRAGNAADLLGSAIIETENGYVSGGMPVAHFGVPGYTEYASGSNARATGGWSRTLSYVDVVVTMPNGGEIWVATVPTNQHVVMPGGGGLNMKPIARAAVDESQAMAGNLVVHFDGTQSYDSDGVLVAYNWDFGDGHDGFGATVSHTYASPGNYVATLTVVDNGGESAVTTVQVVVKAPTVTSQPVNQTVEEGQWATFSVAATGSAPLSYQWQKNGLDIAGATAASYSTPALALGDSGASYRCVVSNRIGIAVSSSATVTVAEAQPLSVVAQPSDVAVTVGRKGLFSAQFTGSWPMSYQWQVYSGGTWQDIAGACGTATESPSTITYWTPVTATGDNGNQYRVQVTNIKGTVTSNAATLTVGDPQIEVETFTLPNGSPWPAYWVFQGDLQTVRDIQNGMGHSGSNSSDFIIINTLHSFGDGIVQAELKGNSGGPKIGLIARNISGDSDSYYAFETGRIGGYSDSNQLYLRRYIDGAGVAIANVTLPFNVPSGTMCTLKLSVVTIGNETEVKAKIWVTGTQEPANWQITAMDAAGRLKYVEGRGGVWFKPSAGRDMYVDNFTVTMYQGSANAEPTASFTADPSSGHEPMNVQFDASGSSDRVGRIVSYAWDFGDGQVGGGVAPSHVFTLDNPLVPQTFTVTLTVTDDDGLTDQTTMDIEVGVEATPPSVLSAEMNGGGAQRSYAASLGLTFSEEVIVTKSDLALYDHERQEYVDLLAAGFSSTADSASWDLLPLNLQAGWYTARLLGYNVTDTMGNSLDGNGDGVGGDDYVYRFHVLPGDFNGDELVDVGDLGILGANYGETGANVPGDANHDGVVNVGDLGILGASYGRVLDWYPNAPTDLSAVAASSSQIDLSWADNANNEDGYNIERSSDGSSDWAQVDSVAPNVTTFSDTGLSTGTTYYYRVYAFTDTIYGDSAYSNTATATTDGDGTTITIVATDDSASEAGPDSGVFTITRAGGPTGHALVVSYSVSGTASGGDYVGSLSGSVTIAEGESFATITITPVDDATVEADETVILTLGSGSGYAIGTPDSAMVTIADNDVFTVTISAADGIAAEAGPDNGVFTVTRTGGTYGDLVVNYNVFGTASSGDYVPLGGSVTILDGQSSATVTVTPVDDTEIEENETVILTLTGGSGYVVASPDSAMVTIVDNDDNSVFVSDDFESGGGSGGTGWTSDWVFVDEAKVATSDAHSGTYSLRVRNSLGEATRAADLSGDPNAHLTFYWLANKFEAADQARIWIYTATGWVNVMTVSDGEDDNAWHYADIDLSGYTLDSNFQLRISADMDEDGDYFYVDDIAIVS